VQEGNLIYIDDGIVKLRVVEKRSDAVICETVGTKPTGSWLKAEKGINFPDSDIDMPALTPSDLQHLDTVADFADIIGISFAQKGSDIEMLKGRLAEQGREGTGIIAKIETKKAVRNLPLILLSLLPWPNSGVMIARGDLAIEVGFEKLPKVQAEILDLCEAAHIPVIYATQILENMMKKNLPSRAEIIDASSAQRADCIMLNKGPFASHAVEVLHRILNEMQGEAFKNKPLLHTTEAWKGFHDRIMQHRDGM
jgi:pyruvate kinase